MNESTNRPRPRRTFSAFGDVRKMPSEYEIVTHGQNWTMRENRPSAFEQNPSSPANLWFLTYRDQSPLQAENWEQFRDPDSLTYRMYVNAQAESESKVHGVLEEYALLGSDTTFAPDSTSPGTGRLTGGVTTRSSSRLDIAMPVLTGLTRCSSRPTSNCWERPMRR